MKRPIHPVALDLATVAALAIVAYLVIRWLDLFDSLVDRIAVSEPFQIEELVSALFMLPFALAIFSLRRWWELRRTLRDREAVEARLADSARLEGIMLAARTMQHEMNNQLGVTVGYAELLAHDPSLSPEQREMAQTALNGAERAAALLDRLRRVTRIDLHHVGAPEGPVLALAGSGAESRTADSR